MDSGIMFGAADPSLTPAPINPDWILEGRPEARMRTLAASPNTGGFSLIWDCTAGRFNWHYRCDETVYIIEGSVTIKDRNGVHRVGAGETIYFPAGSSAEWNVEKYVRKVAFCAAVLPLPLTYMKRAYRYVKKLRGQRGSESGVAAFQ